MALPKKPVTDIDVKAVNDFINGNKNQSTEITEKQPAAKNVMPKDQQTEVSLSYRIPEDIHEKLQEYVFKHRKEGITIKKYLLDSLIEKMQRDNLI